MNYSKYLQTSNSKRNDSEDLIWFNHTNHRKTNAPQKEIRRFKLRILVYFIYIIKYLNIEYTYEFKICLNGANITLSQR